MKKLYDIRLTTLNSLEIIIELLENLQRKKIIVKDVAACLWSIRNSFRTISMQVETEEAELRAVLQQFERLEGVITVAFTETQPVVNFKNYGRG